MQENHTELRKAVITGQKAPIKRKSTAPNVLICLGDETPAPGLLGHAQMVADAMGGNIILTQVIEPPKNDRTPFDPVEWDIQRREARAVLSDLANDIESTGGEVETRLLEGQQVDQICASISARPQDITTVFRQTGSAGWNLNDPARCLVEANVGSVLMIPGGMHPQHVGSISKIVLPLDGSTRSESAIPKAIRLATANDAEIILCHIAPEPRITQLDQSDAAALKLREQVVLQNKRAGQEYLKRIEARLVDCGVRTSTLISNGTDVRRALIKVVRQQNADFIVLASHGQSHHTDVPTGDIAGFVMSRSAVPVLMVRQFGKHVADHIFSDVKSEGVRHPTDRVQ